jgi:hypothetical protein
MAIAWALLGVLTTPMQGDAALDAYMRQLAIAGNVQTENGLVADSRLDAHTKFELNVQSRWEYSLSVVRRNGQLELVVLPTFTKLDTSVRHLLRLPTDDPNTDRFRTLLLHEYDHVAISADGRIGLILKRLILGIGTIQKPWKGPIPPPDVQVNALISAEVESRKNAVVKLVEFAYQKLDRQSDHGRRPLPNRSLFGGWLFTLEHMKEAEFTYVKEAGEAIASGEARLAKRWFRS